MELKFRRDNLHLFVKQMKLQIISLNLNSLHFNNLKVTYCEGVVTVKDIYFFVGVRFYRGSNRDTRRRERNLRAKLKKREPDDPK